ncbi:hypothetical protein, partial [Tessaracoccus oleiagri]
QPEPGVFHWRSPAGYEYLVTATGTTRIGTPPPRPSPWSIEHEPDPWEDPPPSDPTTDQPLQPELIAWAIAQHTLTNAAA